jgi:hypothetical protein
MARRRARRGSRPGLWLLLGVGLLALWAGFRLTSGSVRSERGADGEPPSRETALDAAGAGAASRAGEAPGLAPRGDTGLDPGAGAAPLAVPSATASPGAAMAAQRGGSAQRPAVREELTEDDRRALEEVLRRGGQSDAR